MRRPSAIGSMHVRFLLFLICSCVRAFAESIPGSKTQAACTPCFVKEKDKKIRCSYGTPCRLDPLTDPLTRYEVLQSLAEAKPDTPHEPETATHELNRTM